MNGDRPVIVGAGPAGLYAAIELARAGQPSVLVDEAPKVGGVVYRGPLTSGAGGAVVARLGLAYRRRFERLHADFAAHRDLIDLRLKSRVVGAETDRLWLLENGIRVAALPYRRRVVATGCHERSVPFPGWTLPGVMLLGGLQLSCKSGGVRPAQPVVIVGSGPPPLLVACQLHRAGVQVAGVFEAATVRSVASQWRALVHRPSLLLEGSVMRAYLLRRRVPVYFGWGIVSAAGRAEALEDVTVAPYDNQWRPQLDRTRRLPCSTLGVGYGLLPRTQLSQLLGLAHAQRPDGALAPVVDAAQRSSRDGIYVAGDCAGILGAEAAELQGRMAALDLLEQSGGADAPTVGPRRCQRLEARLQRLHSFRAGIDSYGQPGPGLLELATPATVVCRCENVSCRQIDAAIAEGVVDLASLKMRTRVGMGGCQGKICALDCAQRLRLASGRSDVGWTRPRFPLDPVPFTAFEAS
jgi:hydrogen cyanide synthase HcnB